MRRSARREPCPCANSYYSSLCLYGGTLISKCLALVPNVTLLSEIDPLSQMQNGKSNRFHPSDFLYAARSGLRPISEQMTIRSFNAGIAELHRALGEVGRYLVLRDHAHSQFCTEADPFARPSLRAILQRVMPVQSVLTLRHPLDSFLSLDSNGWHHFKPFTLETYAKRYECFLSEYEDLPKFRYEDFVANPETELEKICTILKLPFHSGTTALLKVVELTGDSGRSSSRIAPRVRRELPEGIAQQMKSSNAYRRLCTRLDYPLHDE
ncbi:sulfotransferase [Sulfitobacter faviae]|uniref:sulfotransferase n=1 Tax=Sulfitobacter faviae TaxID=1775881 RepID=UPI00248884AD|nr:sulfotransferase family protein [Sulfitobacter faviae]